MIYYTSIGLEVSTSLPRATAVLVSPVRIRAVTEALYMYVGVLWPTPVWVWCAVYVLLV